MAAAKRVPVLRHQCTAWRLWAGVLLVVALSTAAAAADTRHGQHAAAASEDRTAGARGGRGGGGGIKVIGAGLGRTGTRSLAAALDILGYKTLHYVDMAHAEQWAAHAGGRASTDSIIDLVVGAGYNATCDNPCADLYAEQLRRFPDARVILTVRDSPAHFERSWITLMDGVLVTERPFSLTFPSFFQWIPLMRHLKALRCHMGVHLGLAPCELTGGWRDKPAGWLAKQYEAHNAQVESRVPREQLLTFNVKQGWGPLCAFLGVPKPSVSFPHPPETQSGSLAQLRLVLLCAVYTWIPAVLLAVWACWCCCCRRRCCCGTAVAKAKES